MLTYLLIALGGAIGSVGRHWLSEAVTTRIPTPFPWGTFLVNITGCFAIGWLAVYTAAGPRPFSHTEARFFFLTGVCGGYTTFSSFSLQTLTLLREGDIARAGGYIVGSFILCLLGVWLGYWLGTVMTTAR